MLTSCQKANKTLGMLTAEVEKNICHGTCLCCAFILNSGTDSGVFFPTVSPFLTSTSKEDKIVLAEAAEVISLLNSFCIRNG